jgi:hypothetical protein
MSRYIVSQDTNMPEEGTHKAEARNGGRGPS